MTALAAFLIYPVDEPTLFRESLNLAEELTTLHLGSLEYRTFMSETQAARQFDPDGCVGGFSEVQIARQKSPTPAGRVSTFDFPHNVQAHHEPQSFKWCDDSRALNAARDLDCSLKIHVNAPFYRAPFFYGAGLRVERRIASKRLCDEVHEHTRSPRQQPVCRIHKVDRHGWSVMFNQQ